MKPVIGVFSNTRFLPSICGGGGEEIRMKLVIGIFGKNTIRVEHMRQEASQMVVLASQSAIG